MSMPINLKTEIVGMKGHIEENEGSMTVPDFLTDVSACVSRMHSLVETLDSVLCSIDGTKHLLSDEPGCVGTVKNCIFSSDSADRACLTARCGALTEQVSRLVSSLRILLARVQLHMRGGYEDPVENDDEHQAALESPSLLVNMQLLNSRIVKLYDLSRCLDRVVNGEEILNPVAGSESDHTPKIIDCAYLQVHCASFNIERAVRSLHDMFDAGEGRSEKN